VIREGEGGGEILKLIEEDEISPSGARARVGKEGRGHWSPSRRTAGTFPIPVAIVPGHLNDDEIDANELSFGGRC